MSEKGVQKDRGLGRFRQNKGELGLEKRSVWVWGLKFNPHTNLKTLP
jgi:hypothetical protein